MNNLSYIQRIMDDVLEALAPDHCEICSHKLSPQTIIHRICDSCLMGFEEAPKPESILNSLLKNSHRDSLLVHAESLFSFHHESQVFHAIHVMKYDFGKKMAFDFGNLMAKRCTCETLDAIVPVPLHKARLRERGFNQSQEIAEGFLFGSRIPVLNCLQRNRYTTSQTKLTADERLLNMKHVFEILPDFSVQNKHVLLVDDVLTTGSTLEACAEILLEKGARSVSAMTIAAAIVN